MVVVNFFPGIFEGLKVFLQVETLLERLKQMEEKKEEQKSLRIKSIHDDYIEN
jgi:hypothetical protein